MKYFVSFADGMEPQFPKGELVDIPHDSDLSWEHSLGYVVDL